MKIGLKIREKINLYRFAIFYETFLSVDRNFMQMN